MKHPIYNHKTLQDEPIKIGRDLLDVLSEIFFYIYLNNIYKMGAGVLPISNTKEKFIFIFKRVD